MVAKTISYRKKSKKHLRKKSKKHLKKIKTKKIKFIGGVKYLKIEPQIKPQRVSSRTRKSTSRYSPSSPNNRTITKRRQRFSKSKKDKPPPSLPHVPPSALAQAPPPRFLSRVRALFARAPRRPTDPKKFRSPFDRNYGKETQKLVGITRDGVRPSFVPFKKRQQHPDSVKVNQTAREIYYKNPRIKPEEFVSLFDKGYGPKTQKLVVMSRHNATSSNIT